jgi:hypothetical protein
MDAGKVAGLGGFPDHQEGRFVEIDVEVHWLYSCGKP